VQERLICVKHPHIDIRVKDGKQYCRLCSARNTEAELTTMTELWHRDSVPSFEEMLAGVDESIMDFLWVEKSGTLINLFLYFNAERKPLNPREFLEFWGSLSAADQDYYMTASAEGLRDEASGGVS
jgi:hypothetical protein